MRDIQFVGEFILVDTARHFVVARGVCGFECFELWLGETEATGRFAFHLPN